MITPSFNITSTERVLPKLALDFTTASLDARVTFTRTTGASNPATYVNSSGYITAATNNQPRFDYDPITLACKGLLIEESRTNVMPFSNDFSGWTNNGATVSASSETSPDGTTNATLVTGASGNLRIYKLLTGLSSTSTYSFSWFAKAGTSNTITIDFVNVANGPTFNFSTGTWGPSGSWTVNKQQFGNGWWRLTATVACNTTTAGPGLRVASASSTAHIFGFQMEVGAFATSYIPTEATALTRNADVATMTGTNFSDWFTQNNGSFTTEYIRYTGSGVGLSRNILSVSDGTNNNRIELNMANATNDGCYIVTGGSPQAQIVGGTALFNQIARMAVGFQENNTSVAVNGANSVTDTSVLIPTVDRMNIGRSGGGSGGFYNGWIRKIYFYPQRLINLELQSFSK